MTVDMRFELRVRPLCLVFAASLLSPLGCGDGAPVSADSEKTSGEVETDTEADPDPTATPDPSVADTDEADTDAANTDSDGPELPADCSCYDPWVDADLGVDESCRAAEEVLPGCAEESSCGAIVLSRGFGESGGEEAEFEDPQAVVCIARALASGSLETFQVRTELFNGSVTTSYLPKPGGGYHRYSCGLVDNPPIVASVTSSEPDTEALSACVASYDEDADETALYACLDAQLDIEGERAMACE